MNSIPIQKPINVPSIQDIAKPNKAEKAKGTVSFGDTLNGFMKDVNNLQIDAGKSVERLLTGEIKDVHDVMIAVEKAGTSFELMMEIRNKMLDAYREVMRMQV